MLGEGEEDLLQRRLAHRVVLHARRELRLEVLHRLEELVPLGRRVPDVKVNVVLQWKNNNEDYGT